IQMRQADHCNEGPLQRNGGDSSPGVASPALTHQIQNTKGNGESLAGHTQAEMESRIGVNFSEVRIHKDRTSTEMNNALQAQAFTHGKDIYFNEGKYNPESPSGKHLLAHELTHVVQQGGGSNITQNKLI